MSAWWGGIVGLLALYGLINLVRAAAGWLVARGRGGVPDRPRIRLSVVLLFQNQEAEAEGILRRLLGRLGGCSRIDPEVIAVDEGSTDGTLAILRAMARSRPVLRVLEWDPKAAAERGEAPSAAQAGLFLSTRPLVLLAPAAHEQDLDCFLAADRLREDG